MKIWLVFGAAAAGFFAGGLAAGLHYNAQISDLKATASEAAAKYQQSLLKRESEYAKKLSAAADAKQAEIDRLNDDLVSMRSDVDRLRVAAAGRRTVSGTKSSAGKSGERQDGSCLRLLEEGAGLLEEGGGLLRDFNADREAMRKLK